MILWYNHYILWSIILLLISWIPTVDLWLMREFLSLLFFTLKH